MDLALVTGADKEVGERISQKLIEQGFRVYGFAQSFREGGFAHREFYPVVCDLTSPEMIQKNFEAIVERGERVFAVVHAEQRKTRNAFETTETDEMVYALQCGLIGPMVLTRLALPHLLKYHGYVINVAWNGQRRAPWGAVSAATQGGLFHFGRELFAELRDTGVKVCTVSAEENRWDETGDDNDEQSGQKPPRRVAHPQSRIEPELVAETVAQLLRFRENNLLSEIVIRPQGTREEPRIPVAVAPLVMAPHDVCLPDPDKALPAPEPIYTPEPKRPADAPPPGYDDDEDDEEDEDDELDLLLAQTRDMLKADRDKPRNRRGGRNRRNKSRGDKPSDSDEQNKPAPREPQEARPTERPEPSEAAPQGEDSGNRSESRNFDQSSDEQNGDNNGNRRKRRRRRGRRNGRERERSDSPHQPSPGPVDLQAESRSAPSEVAKPAPQAQKPTPAPSRTEKPQAAPQPAQTGDKPAPKKKVARKKAARKAKPTAPAAADAPAKPAAPAEKPARKKAAKKKAVKKKAAKKKSKPAGEDT